MSLIVLGFLLHLEYKFRNADLVRVIREILVYIKYAICNVEAMDRCI